ncbi:MAG: sigma-70 family RNA polymerase sigma factor [Myxococcota bacterium]
MPRPSPPASQRLRLVTSADEAVPTSLDPEDVYRCFSRYVAVIAHRIMGNPEDADDVLQDVFVDFQRSRKRIREPKAVRGWLATATVRIARRRLWRRRFLGLIGLDDPDYREVADAAASPEHRAEITTLYRMLDSVPPGPRTAWVLRRVHGASLQEVVEYCGVSLATAKRWVSTVDGRVGEVFRDE